VKAFLIAGRLCAAAAALFLTAGSAHAELVLSELIVDFQPGKQDREDLEIWNNSPDRSYVAVEPRQIIDPSLPSQRDFRDPDPEKLGLLVAPARMILEPGQRKLIRIAALTRGANREQVYRVTVKPVVGGIKSEDSGLKIVVGYDVLVLVRPAQSSVNVTGKRTGRKLTFTNSGNESVEIVDGRQCEAANQQCAELPSKRLYPGASWIVDLQSDRPVQYLLKSPGKNERRTY
jgi:P pilus assembly chaperone PapD